MALERENINNLIADDLDLRNRNWGAIDTQLSETEQEIMSFKEDYAKQSSIKGTKQSITFNDDGTVQKIEHKNSLNEIVRVDTFTYATNLITEVRTLATGETLTFVNHLDTLETEVI